MKKAILLVMLICCLVHAVDPVYIILHIGDSISKIGVQSSIDSWLSSNYPDITYISTALNNNGIVDYWGGHMWDMIYQYHPDILLVNSGMWDRDDAETEFETRFSVWARQFKAAFPKCRVIWASATLTNGLPGNDTITSNNSYAIAVLDSVYGAGEWYYIDMAQVQIDSSVAFSGDNIHPSDYSTYAGEWTNTLDTVIPAFTYITEPTVDSVAYGVCRNCPADFKTGSPTVTISNDTAYFSIAQTDVLMGVGAAIYYDDGAKKIGYIKASGKVNKSTWLISNAVGVDPAGCIDATVDSINHEFKSIKTAFTNHSDATHINNTDRTAGGADICVHLPCYMEQTTYTQDNVSAGYAQFNSSSGDMSHRLYVYSPIDTFTQCNKKMGAITPKFDSTKYVFKGYHAVGPLYKTTVNSWLEFKNIQIYQYIKTNTGAQNIGSINHGALFDYVSFTRCIFLTETPNTSGTYRGLYVGTTGSGVTLINNCLFICNNGSGTNSGNCIETACATDIHMYNNTFIGGWNKFFSRTSGSLYIYNNVLSGVQYKGTNVLMYHDYNLYDIDETETNGILTTQTYTDLFADTTNDSMKYWDYTPITNSDIDTINISYNNHFNVDITGFLYDSAYSNPGAFQIRSPYIDSIHCRILRDSTYNFAARPGDSLVIYGHGFDDSLYFTHFYQNSTGTVSANIVTWHNHTDIDSIVITPYTAVTGWYKSFITTKDSSITNNSYIWIKNPGGYY